MSRTRTPQALRKLAAELSERYPGCRAGAAHDSGRAWNFTWTNGPTPSQVRAQVATAAPEAEVDLRRSYSPRSWALAGIRACLDGQVGYRADGAALSWQLEGVLTETEDPDRPGQDDREAAMAQALLERSEDTLLEHVLLEPLTKEGVAALLTPRQAKLDASDVLVMTPAEHLTSRYARGEDVRQWRMRLRTLPAPDLVAAAQADPELDQAGRLAVLGLLEDMRQLWENTEAQAFAAARDATAPGGAASWAQVGAVLGISRQGAQDRGKRRASGGPSRLA